MIKLLRISKNKITSNKKSKNSRIVHYLENYKDK